MSLLRKASGKTLIKKKNIIFIVSLIIFLSIIISDVNAYKKLCLQNGEGVPLPPKTPRYTCVLTSGAGYCQICVTDLYNPADLNRCLNMECEYLSGQQQTDLTMTVGVSDGQVFNTKSLSLNIHTSREAKIEYKDNTNNKWITLCTHCDDHNKKRGFKEGLDDITIRASRSGQVVEKIVSFFVDSKKPRITKLSPTNNAYGKGEFSVSYDEDNLKSVSLYINNVFIEKKSYPDCPKGKKQTCTFNKDLTGYEGQIEFYFIIEDAINVIQSKSNRIKVDLTNPILTVNNPLSQDYPAGKILFDMTADDKYTLQYSINGEKFKTLCANCNKYKNYKTFGTGSYNLILQAVDKAGNIDQKIKNFNVI